MGWFCLVKPLAIWIVYILCFLDMNLNMYMICTFDEVSTGMEIYTYSLATSFI